MSAIIEPEHAASLNLPKWLFLFVFALGEVIPYVARLPGAAAHGREWLDSYLLGVGGLLFLLAVNLIPVFAVWGLGKGSRRWPLAFWFAVAGMLGILFWGHGTINLSASSTAAIGLIFIPVYAAAAGVVAWLAGLAAHFVVRNDRARVWAASAVVGGASLLGVAVAVNETQTETRRESRFPIVSVQEIPLAKREIDCCAQGRVEVLRLGAFDGEAGDDVLALSDHGATLLDPASYGVKRKYSFRKDSCDFSCIGMYPDVVPDGNGGFAVVSSDGVANSEGRLLWKFESDSFRKIVPVRISEGGDLAFFTKQIHQRVERRDAQGTVLWTVEVPVSDIAAYRTAEGETQLLVLVSRGQEGELLQFYGVDGKMRKQVSLPNWVMHAQQVAWPAPGNLLVGAGPMVAVTNASGQLLLEHLIENTSFRPYHGPDGTAVQFDPKDKPYLAVLSHGSSGYARSALLIFNAQGRLVWKEELHKVHAVLAVRRSDGKGDALLLGGDRGLVEYRLGDRVSSPE